jgi:3-oxoacyl-[acyl-carrier protein] reductase
MKHMSKLQGKVAIVTGASKGIGAGIAKAMAAEGASVVVNYASSRAGADKTVQEIVAAGGKAIAVQGDVSNDAGAKAIVDAAIKEYGRLDSLVNNAGVFEFQPIENVTAEHYHAIFDINVLGVLLMSKAASPHLKEGGSIINIGSVVSTLTPPQSAVYSATKGAVDSITGVLAQELGPRKIRVNSVNPGMVDTEGAQSAGFIGSDFEKDAIQKTPLGRTGLPKDIGTVVAFLASDDAGWLSGQRISASGGFR